MRILVTGAAGYLGQVLFRRLEVDHDITGIDNFLYNQRLTDRRMTARISRGDITSVRDMYQAAKDVDVVIALAAIVGDPACALNEDETIAVNYEATKVLVDVCESQRVKKIIFASSCSVYGESDNNTVTETGPCVPLSLYAKTRVMSEEVLLGRCKSVTPVILRFATLYGCSPRMRFDLVVNIMTAMAVKERTIVVRGGEQWRPLVHIQDVATAIQHVVEQPCREHLYNVVGENVQIKDIAASVKTVIPQAQVVHLPEERDLRNYKVSGSRLQEEFSMAPSYGLLDGTCELKAALENGNFIDFKDDRYYNVRILNGLYEHKAV